jgi:uncharacterized protein YjiS (DUF1127 family)
MTGQTALGACKTAWNALLKRIESAAAWRAGEAELRQMNDRELADLGLGRSGITFAVRTSPGAKATGRPARLKPIRTLRLLGRGPPLHYP